MYWTKEKDDKLSAAIIIYKKTQDRYIADKIIKTITPIVDRTLNTVNRKYFNLPPIDDLRQEVLLQCSRSLNNFDPCYRNGVGKQGKAYSYVIKITQNTICKQLKKQIRTNRLFIEPTYENTEQPATDFDLVILDKIIDFMKTNHPCYLQIAIDLKRHIMDNGKLFLKEFKRDYKNAKINRFFSLLRNKKVIFDKL